MVGRSPGCRCVAVPPVQQLARSPLVVNPVGLFQVFRILRLVRVFRLFRMSRTSAVILIRTMQKSSKPMYMLIFFTSIAMVFFSSLLYYCERGVYDPELVGAFARPRRTPPLPTPAH